MSRDLWATRTVDHDTAYGMDYVWHTAPDGRLLSEDARPVDEGHDEDDDYDRGGEW